MAVCFIGIGSNLGDRRENIKRALKFLKKTDGLRIKKISKLYETVPIGGPPQGKFLNGAIRIETNLSPLKLLNILKDIERKIGRKKTRTHNQPRPIDLDILIYGNNRIKTRYLEIPHPRMREREFVLRPLSELI